MNGISNSQRALWMVLITSLAAPFFASVVHVAMTLASPWLDFAVPPRGNRAIGEVAMAAFAWGAIPSTIAALGLIPYVLQNGTYGWLQAAIAGVVAFIAAALIVPFGAGTAMPFLAFMSGLLALGMRAMLIEGRILLE